MTQASLEPLSFGEKSFVLGSRRGRVSGGIGESRDKGEGDEDRCQEKNSPSWLSSFELRQVVVFTERLLHLASQPLAQKLCCRWSVFELDHQDFELKCCKKEKEDDKCSNSHFAPVNKVRNGSQFTPFLEFSLFMELLELCCPVWELLAKCLLGAWNVLSKLRHAVI